jgi:DNA-binding transcriptional LysR family regulator
MLAALAVNQSHRLARRQRVTPVQAAREPLPVFCPRDYPEYKDMVTGWLREHRQRPRITGEYDGEDSLMAAVESGLGVAIVATRVGRLVPERVRLEPLSPSPPLLCIAAGYRANRAEDKPLSAFVEKLCRAGHALS